MGILGYAMLLKGFKFPIRVVDEVHHDDAKGRYCGSTPAHAVDRDGKQIGLHTLVEWANALEESL